MASQPLNDIRIEELLPRFNAVMAKEGTDISHLGGNASDDEVVVAKLPAARGRIFPTGGSAESDKESRLTETGCADSPDL